MNVLDLYKNSQVHKFLISDKKSKMLSHAYILDSVDKFVLDNFSLYMAKDILCLLEDSPCDQCVNCLKIEHSNMVDLKVYPKGEKSLVVEDINEIVDDSIIRAMDNDFKIYILKDFDLATVQAQNKLLKTLEEPPEGVIFILTSANSSQILPTIISRSKRLYEPLFSRDVVEKYLTDLKIKDGNIIASICGGNISIAEKLTKNGEADKIINLAFSTLLGLKTSGDILKYSSEILVLKKDIPFFVDTMINVLRDVVVFEFGGDINFVDYTRNISTLSQMYSVETIKKIVEKINLIYKKLDFNCNVSGVIDKMLLDILEVRFLCQK